MAKSLFTTIISLALLQACITEDTIIPATMPEAVPVRFSSDNSGIPTRTGSGDNAWMAGDSIGIYMMSEPENNLANSIADNRAYRVTTSDNGDIAFTAGSSQTIFYPFDGNVNFVAYYPYKPTGGKPGNISNYVYPVDVSRQQNLALIDVLYGANETPQAYGSEAVNLKFEHKLSKIVLYITSDPGVVLHDMKGIINGMPAMASLNLNTGVVTAANEKRVFDIFGAGRPPDNEKITDNDTTFEAIVVPHLVNNPPDTHTTTIQFMTSQQKQYTWDIPDGLNIEPGYVYYFKLSFRDDPQSPVPRTRGTLADPLNRPWKD
jgi:hypothetical protein